MLLYPAKCFILCMVKYCDVVPLGVMFLLGMFWGKEIGHCRRCLGETTSSLMGQHHNTWPCKEQNRDQGTPIVDCWRPLLKRATCQRWCDPNPGIILTLSEFCLITWIVGMTNLPALIVGGWAFRTGATRTTSAPVLVFHQNMRYQVPWWVGKTFSVSAVLEKSFHCLYKWVWLLAIVVMTLIAHPSCK